MATPLVAGGFPGVGSLTALQASGTNAMNSATASRAGLVGEIAKAKSDIARSILSNADSLAEVFGGQQTGAMAESYVNLPSLRGLQDASLTGGMTTALDNARLAVLAQRASGGGGGSSGGKGNWLITYKDGEKTWTEPYSGKPADIRNLRIGDSRIVRVEPAGGGGATTNSGATGIDDVPAPTVVEERIAEDGTILRKMSDGTVEQF